MAKPGQPKSGDFVELPEMEWLTCEIASAEVGEDTYNGETKTRVAIVFKVLDPEYPGGQMNYWAGFSLHEKSKLRPLAEAVTGLTGDALFEAFDTDDLVGKRVMVIGKNKTRTKDGEEQTFMNPTMFKAVGGKKTATTASEPKATAASGDINF